LEPGCIANNHDDSSRYYDAELVPLPSLASVVGVVGAIVVVVVVAGVVVVAAHSH
jgi:hypothetical protein